MLHIYFSDILSSLVFRDNLPRFEVGQRFIGPRGAHQADRFRNVQRGNPARRHHSHILR